MELDIGSAIPVFAAIILVMFVVIIAAFRGVGRQGRSNATGASAIRESGQRHDHGAHDHGHDHGHSHDSSGGHHGHDSGGG